MVGYLHLFIIEQPSRIYTSVLSALLAEEAQLESVVEQARRGRRRRPQQAQTLPPAETMLTADSEWVRVEEAREAGAVHVGYRMWERLGLSAVLQAAGLPRRACLLSEAMTLNRLIFLLSERAMPDWIRRPAAFGDKDGHHQAGFPLSRE